MIASGSIALITGIVTSVYIVVRKIRRRLKRGSHDFNGGNFVAAERVEPRTFSTIDLEHHGEIPPPAYSDNFQIESCHL